MYVYRRRWIKRERQRASEQEKEVRLFLFDKKIVKIRSQDFY